MLKFLKQIIQWIAGTGFTGSLQSGNSANEDWRSWVDYKNVNPGSNIQDWFENEYGTTVNDRGVATSPGIHIGSGSSDVGLGAFLGALTNRITGRELTGAEREQNAFNASQAQIDRDFQERMANTQYQRAVTDMRGAGVNPALAMQNGGNAAPSGAMASGAGSGAFASNFSDLMQLLMLKPQMELMRAQAENLRAGADKSRSETELVGKHISIFDALTDAQIRDINSRISAREVQNRLNEQGISESEARQSLYAQQTINAHLDEQYIAKLNDAQVKYQESLTAYTNQHTKESEQAVKESAARIDGIYQQAILQSAMAGYYSQSELNLLEQQGILQYEKEQHKFTVDHQRADRNWRLASTVVGMVQSIGQTAAGAAIGMSALGRAGLVGSHTVTASPWSFHNTGGFDWIGY